VVLPEELVESFDGAVSQAPESLSLSRSEIVRYAVQQGVEEWSEDVEDLVPDEHLARYRTEAEEQRIQAAYYVIDKREGWRGRVKSYLNARLAGEEPYTPEGVESLAEGYREELRTLHRLAPDSSRTLDEDLAWMDEQVQAYRDAYLAKQTVPDGQPYEGVDDKVSIGRDLLSLKENVGQLVEDLADRAESAAYDADAIIRSLAAEYAVSEDAVTVVLDVVLPDDVDHRQALKSLESKGVDEILPPEAVDDVEQRDPALDGEVMHLDDDKRTDMVAGDLGGHTVQVEMPEDVDDNADAPGVAEEELAAIVDEEIRTNGHDAGDDDAE
jgi:hypothetical protein